MAVANVKLSSSSTLESFFKTRYGDLHKLIPSMFSLQKSMPFNEAERLGDKYAEVALLQGEHGVTYMTAGEDNATLAASIAGQTKGTEIQGSQHVLTTQIGYNAIRSAKKKGPEAFAGTMDMVTDNALQSLRKRVEIDMFYGGQTAAGLALVSSIDGDFEVVTIAAAEWAPGIWAGAEGAVLNVFAPAFSEQRDDTATNAVITSIDMSARTVTCDGGGTVEFPNDTVAGDIIVFMGQYSSGWKTQKGLKACLTETSTLFNISCSYSLWKPSTYAVGSTQLTFSKVQKAVYKVMSKGFKGDMKLMVNPTTWADLLDDEAALRRHSSGGVKQYEVGASGIKFYTACGTITIESSLYCKEGEAYLLPENKAKGSRWRRIGASDVGFDTEEGAAQIERVAGQSSWEFRLYDNQAIYTGRPGYSCILTGIVNAT